MKIVGFEAEGGLRLGIVEGDQVVDLQAIDPNLPGDLAAVLDAMNGNLKPRVLDKLSNRSTIAHVSRDVLELALLA